MLVRAYDKAAIKCNGREAVTNFEPGTYEEELSSEADIGGKHFEQSIPFPQSPFSLAVCLWPSGWFTCFLLPLISLAGEYHDLDLNLGIAPPHRANCQTQNMETGSFQIHCGSNNLPENGAKVQWTFRYGFYV